MTYFCDQCGNKITNLNINNNLMLSHLQYHSVCKQCGNDLLKQYTSIKPLINSNNCKCGQQHRGVKIVEDNGYNPWRSEETKAFRDYIKLGSKADKVRVKKIDKFLKKHD